MIWGDEYLRLGKRSRLAEKSKFTSLNDDFTKRLKDENRVKDEKNVNEKFLQNSPPAKKIWRVEGEKE